MNITYVAYAMQMYARSSSSTSSRGDILRERERTRSAGSLVLIIHYNGVASE